MLIFKMTLEVHFVERIQNTYLENVGTKLLPVSCAFIKHNAFFHL